MRTSSWLVSVSLFALACSDAGQPEPLASRSAASTPSAGPSSSPGPGEASVVDPAGPAPVVQANEASDLPPDPQPSLSAPAEPPPEDADPLAPILPTHPEPGSPEADAELEQLLAESTLTQDEFDAAFRGGKPNVEGDQLVFGPGDRTRKAPVVTIGTPKVSEISGSKLTATEVTKLVSNVAKTHQRELEGCLAVALIEDPTTRGSVTLALEFDAAGKTSKLTVEGGADLGAPLRECLAAVADDWSLAGAAKARVALPLSLASE